MTEIAAPLQPGETRNGVLCVPDTVPDLPEIPRYFKKMNVGLGQTRAKLRDFDADIREAILAAKGRAPTLGEYMVIKTILVCELEILLAQKACQTKQKDLAFCLDMTERQRKASIERDKHFEKLGLGAAVQTSLAAILYGKSE